METKASGRTSARNRMDAVTHPQANVGYNDGTWSLLFTYPSSKMGNHKTPPRGEGFSEELSSYCDDSPSISPASLRISYLEKSFVAGPLVMIL